MLTGETLQDLAKADLAFDFGESESSMSGGAGEVAEHGVGSQLGAASSAAPVLDCRNERRAYALTAVCRIDEPAFQIRDTIGVTAFGVRADRHLGESNRLACV